MEQGMALTDVKNTRARLQATVEHLILYKISHCFTNYPIKKIERGIVCPLCFEQKIDYISICCQIRHVVCTDCYCGILRTGETINCPICRGGVFMREDRAFEYTFVPHPINIYRAQQDEEKDE